MNLYSLIYALQNSYNTTEALRDEAIGIIKLRLQDSDGVIDLVNIPVKQFLYGKPRDVVGLALADSVYVDEMGDASPAVLLSITIEKKRKSPEQNVMPLEEVSTPVLIAILERLYFKE